MYFSHTNPARFPKVSEMVNNLFMVAQEYRVRQDPAIWLLSPSGPNFSSEEGSLANRKPALCAPRRDAAGTGLGRLRPLGGPEGRARKKSLGRVGRKGKTLRTPLPSGGALLFTRQGNSVKSPSETQVQTRTVPTLMPWEDLECIGNKWVRITNQGRFPELVRGGHVRSNSESVRTWGK